MANKLSCYIDLLKIQGAHRLTIKNKQGEPTDCIVIALPNSRVRFGKKGGAHLSLSIVPNKEGADDFDNTHWICEPTTKEERESANPPKFPILGNAREYINSSPPSRRIESAPPGMDEMSGDVDGDEIPF